MGAVDQLKSGRYRARLRDEATGERISLGSYRTKREAEKALATALTDRERGAWVRPDAGAVTLENYAGEWLASRLGRHGEPLRPRVRELYESELRLHILPRLGPIAVGRLRPDTIRRWHSELITSGLGASTIAKCYRLLRAILNTAVEDGLIVANPCSITGAGAERAAERPLPTISQVFELADAVDERHRALVIVAALSGLRRGELFGLRREHIEVASRSLVVEQQRQQLVNGANLIAAPKSQAGRRVVALPPQAFDVLANHLERFVGPESTAWVFTGDKGGPLREAVWQQEWSRARRKVGLPELHFHDLRHLAATLAATTGAGVKEIMYRIGHSSPQAALRYQHATLRRDRTIAAGIENLIRADGALDSAGMTRRDPGATSGGRSVGSRLGHEDLEQEVQQEPEPDV